MEKLFLICALALPSPHHTKPAVESYHAARSEQQELEEFLRRHHPGADIVIRPTVGNEKLKQNGWEQVPFLWRGNEIWIRRKPVSDKRIGASA